MKSSTIIKSRSPKSNISNMGGGRSKNYLNKNLQKKYIYKKEKALALIKFYKIIRFQKIWFLVQLIKKEIME